MSTELLLQTVSRQHKDYLPFQKGCSQYSTFPEGLAAKVVTEARLEWAVDSFSPCKSPGVDCVYPALLQRRMSRLRLIVANASGVSGFQLHTECMAKSCRVHPCYYR
ncbi:hypothetical protein Zmor_010945 [Zophobas morio]|uniref:Uncharacterized protein n=1 Tax=Zophobas morio TaxID=2755281 RepID=A0AA38MKF8_9CUCU|nr:hypothetical protein Zmor_010945 [Zophobas morio]